MIRYSGALLFSLFIHSLFFIVYFFFFYSHQDKKKAPNREKVVQLSLSTYAESKPSLVQPTKKPKQKKEKKSTTKPTLTKKKKIQKVKEKKIIKEVPLPKKQELVQVEKVEKIKKEEPKKVVEQELKKRVEQELETVKKVVASTTVTETLKPPQKKELSSQEVYINENLEKIRNLIKENLYYPRSARKRGITGEVLVSLTLSKEGRVESLEVKKSEHSVLGRAAIKTIEDIVDKLPLPQEELVIEIPIIYSLE